MSHHQSLHRTLFQISVITPREAEDAVATLMERLFGARATSYTDAASQMTTTTIYLPKPLTGLRRKALQEGLVFIKRCGLNLHPGRILSRKVRREDWRESWKKNFRALEIGPALLIKPSWCARKGRKGQAVVILDPGLSFGTGQHPTTAFCLQELVRARAAGTPQSMLDLGTGSGILAIAAAKLGYHPVRAIDNDSLAVRVAKGNARRNRVDKRLVIARKDLTRFSAPTRTRYDVITANLTADLLIAEAAKIVACLKPAGRLVLAGVLEGQFGAVQRRYMAGGFGLELCRREKEWASGVFSRAAG
jgi:ribosomal protein L11 methyltransferase